MEADADYAVVCPAIQLSDLIAAAGKTSYLYYFSHLQGSDGEFGIPPLWPTRRNTMTTTTNKLNSNLNNNIANTNTNTNTNTDKWQ